MNKLKVLTFMNLKRDESTFRKVRTVDNIPKILTIISSGNSPKKSKRRSSQLKHPGMNAI